MRSSRLAGHLASKLSIAGDAARKQISRVRAPVCRLPYMLPKRESFLYREDDWGTEKYWLALLADLRESGSIYGMAIDGLVARGGLAQAASFKVVSGAPVAQKGQVPVEGVIKRLEDVGFIRRVELGNYGECFELRPQTFPLVTLPRV